MSEGKKVSYEFDLASQSVKLQLDLNQDGKPSLTLEISAELIKEIYAEIHK